MTTTIAVMNFKGGVGKTTLAILLANALASRGKRVLVSDCDPQQSASEWSQWSKNTSMVEVTKVAKIRPRKMTSEHDVVIMDCPPRYGEQCIAAAIAADIALVPVCAGPLDYAATEILLKTLREANKARDSALPVIFVPNRVQPRLRITAVLVQALAELSKQIDNARVSTVVVPLRAGYVEALMNQWVPLTGDSAKPILNLCDEIFATVNT